MLRILKMSGELLEVNVGKELSDVTALKQHLARQNLTARFRCVFVCFSALIALPKRVLFQMKSFRSHGA